MSQHELPGVTPEQLGATLGIDPAGIICGGGRIVQFRRGWALAIFSTGKKAHYFERTELESVAEARCGMVAPVRTLYGEGNWPRCARCNR